MASPVLLAAVVALVASLGASTAPIGGHPDSASRSAGVASRPMVPAVGPASRTGMAAGRPRPAAGSGEVPSDGSGPGAPAPPGVEAVGIAPVGPPLTVLTPFDPPDHAYGRGHRGVDLAAEAGSRVRAALGGTVAFAGMVAGRGVVSVQNAHGLRTTFEPVAASVTVGDRVRAGDVLGTLASGHPSCAPASCLHLGLRRPDGSYLDPMLLFRPGRAVLLPWG